MLKYPKRYVLHSSWFVLLNLFAFGALEEATIAAKETSLPRYNLHLGDEFYYEVDLNFVAGGENGRRLDQCHVWVVRSDADGSNRLLLRNRLGNPGKPGETLEAGGDKFVSYGYIDIHADGRIKSATQFIDIEYEFEYFLPLLPKDESEKQRGWQRVVANHGIRYRYSVKEDAPEPDGKDSCVFYAIAEHPYGKVVSETLSRM